MGLDEEYDAYLKENSQGQDLDSEYDNYLKGFGNKKEEERVIKEQYAPVQLGNSVSRLAIKNLGGDKMGKMNYLHKNHPDSEFKYSKDEEILGRDRGSKDWRYMDVPMDIFSPSTWEAQDITDLGTDIAGGVAEGAATLAAGTAGMVGSPLGALAAGATAAGATATGVEGLKQGLAKWLGTREEIDAGDIATTGAMAAAMTPLFGVGGGGKLVKKIGSMSFKNEAEKEAAKALAMKAEQGLVEATLRAGGNASKNFGQTLASMSSGAEKVDIKTWFDNKEFLEKATDIDMMELSDTMYDDLWKGVDQRVKDVSNEFDVLKAEGRNIDLSDSVGTLKDKIESLSRKAQRHLSPEELALAKKEMVNTANNIFGIDVMSGKVNADFSLERAMNIDRDIKDAFSNSGLMSGSKQRKTNIKNTLLSGLPESVTKNIDNALKDARYTDVKRKYKTVMKLKEELRKSSGDKASLFANLVGIDTKAGKKRYQINQLKQMTEDLGIPYEEKARLIRAHMIFKDPKYMPLSGTATSTSRSMLGGGIGGLLGLLGGGGNPVTAAAGAAAGSVAGSPAMVKNYGNIGSGLGRGFDKINQANRGAMTSRGLWNARMNEDNRDK